MELQIRTSNKYPFILQPFEISVTLSNFSQSKIDIGIPINFELYLSTDKTIEPDLRLALCQCLIIVTSGTIFLNSSGTATVLLMFNKTTRSFSNYPFRIKASIDGSLIPKSIDVVNYTKILNVKPSFSPDIICVVYRLQTTIDLADLISAIDIERSSFDGIWYKDDGGKENCLELRVSVVDGNGSHVENKQSIPLTISLLYESGDAVSDQSILSILSKRPLQIKPSAQTMLKSTILHVRINEVSKNHLRKNFVIMISCDATLDPYLSDIGPAFTPAIEVRSKSVKRLVRGVSRTDGKRDGEVWSAGKAVSPVKENKMRHVGRTALGHQVSVAVSWARQCQTLLEDMKWRLVGWEERGAGEDPVSPSPSPASAAANSPTGRPLFRMKNPNKDIEQLLSTSGLEAALCYLGDFANDCADNELTAMLASDLALQHTHKNCEQSTSTSDCEM